MIWPSAIAGSIAIAASGIHGVMGDAIARRISVDTSSGSSSWLSVGLRETLLSPLALP